MSAHPAYPTGRDLSIEATAATIINADLASAEQMRGALATAAEKIKALKFVTGCPTIGYDIKDVLAALEDMMPPRGNELRSQLEDAAYDLARGAEAEREADAAEYRAEMAREDVR